MMKQERRWFLALILALVAVLSGCKATAEGETSRWTRLSAEATKYASSYPQFKEVLTASLADAKKDFDAAGKDPDKMKAANNKLNKAVGPLSSFQTKVDEINKLMNNSDVRKNSSSEVDGARALAREGINAAHNDLSAAKATTAEELKTVVNSAFAKLGKGERALKKLRDKARKKKSKKRKKKGKKKKR